MKKTWDSFQEPTGTKMTFGTDKQKRGIIKGGATKHVMALVSHQTFKEDNILDFFYQWKVQLAAPNFWKFK